MSPRTHTIVLGPSSQLVRIPLQGLPTLQKINIPTQLVCKLAEGAFDPLSRSFGSVWTAADQHVRSWLTVQIHFIAEIVVFYNYFRGPLRTFSEVII